MAPAVYRSKVSTARPLSSVLAARAAEKRPEANSNGVPRSSSGSVTSEEYYKRLEEEKYAWIRRLAESDQNDQQYEDE